METYIKRDVGEISLLEFQEALYAIGNLEESGEHFIFDEMTGEPIYKNGKGIVYLIGEKNCIGFVEYQKEAIYTQNVPMYICNSLADKLRANVQPITYHG